MGLSNYPSQLPQLDLGCCCFFSPPTLALLPLRVTLGGRSGECRSSSSSGRAAAFTTRWNFNLFRGGRGPLDWCPLRQEELCVRFSEEIHRAGERDFSPRGRARMRVSREESAAVDE